MVASQLESIVTSLFFEIGPSERVKADNGYIGEASHNIKYPMSVINLRARKKIQGRLSSR